MLDAAEPSAALPLTEALTLLSCILSTELLVLSTCPFAWPFDALP